MTLGLSTSLDGVVNTPPGGGTGNRGVEVLGALVVVKFPWGVLTVFNA